MNVSELIEALLTFKDEVGDVRVQDDLGYELLNVTLGAYSGSPAINLELEERDVH